MNIINKKILLTSLLLITFLMFNAMGTSSALECKYEPLQDGGGLGAHCGDLGEPLCEPGLECLYSM